MSLYCISIFAPTRLETFENGNIRTLGCINTLEEWHEYRAKYDSIYEVLSISVHDTGVSITLVRK